MKKHKKWLIALIAVVLLAVIGVAVIAFSSKNQNTQSTKTNPLQSKLYWNVERARYVSQGFNGTSSRIPDSDGLYRINMAVDGEQVMVPVQDAALVNRIDFEEVMGLVFDENGIATDILYLDDFTGGIAADKYSVVSINGNTVVCNTSITQRGINFTYELNENTKVWQVGDFEPLVGLPSTIVEGDQVLMIRDLAGNISDVYVFPFIKPGDVYWNITRMWSDSSQTSTRERDALGFFVYDFAINGEIKTLRTRDQEVANLIDKHVSQSMGFEFDANGDIIAVLNAGNKVCGGGLLCTNYRITELNGTQATATLNENVYPFTISKDCKFFDVSGNGTSMGAPVDGIQIGDKVVVLKDRRDQACVIFITGRITTDDIYWVVERTQVWNRTTWTTNRKPAADGWYYIKLAGNGKQITARCQDAELVNKLDSYVCWCVKLDGDRIVSIQDATAHYGGSLFGAFNKVLSINGQEVTIEKNGSTQTAMLADDCLFYNVSSLATTAGEPTSLKNGDTIYGFKDLDGNIRYVFITNTTYNGRIYWNVTRMYDDVKKETTREKGADGYYHFEMVVDGKVVWLKTASREIANKVDLVKTRARGLVLSGDVILDVLAPEKLTAYPGVKPDANFVTVTEVDGNQITATKNGEEFKITLASNCKIYNVTNFYEDHRGETTTIRPGDQLVTLINSGKRAVIAYVCGGRTTEFNPQPNECICTQNVKWKPWDGKSELYGGYYYLTADVTAPAGGFEISGKSVYLQLNGHTVTADQGRAFVVKNAGYLGICGHGKGGAVIGAGSGSGTGGVIQVASSNARADIYHADIYSTGGEMENGGVLSVSGYVSLYNVNVYGGAVTKKGGNIVVVPSGTLRMFGGSIQSGTAALDGANLFISGNAYLEGVAIQGGISASVSEKTCVLKDCTVTGGQTGLDISSGQVTLSGNIRIAENAEQNLHLGTGCTVRLEQFSAESYVMVTAAGPGVFCENASQEIASAFHSTDPELSIKYANEALSLIGAHTHGFAPEGAQIGFTQLTQAMFDNAAADTAPVSTKGTNLVLAPGNYYLKEDISLNAQILVTGEMSLCLNGHTLQATDSRVFAVTGGTLTITDCHGEGKLVGGTAGSGATILLQGSKGAQSGSPALLNVYAGTLVGGNAQQGTKGRGGNVHVYYGTFNLYGGTLQGGSASASGGNVYVESSADNALNLYGGKLISGTAEIGPCLYADANTNITLNGIAVLDAVYLNGTQLVVEQIPETFTTEINAASGGVLIQNIREAVAAQFTTVPENTLIYDPETSTLSLHLPVSDSHSHCLCSGLAGHTCTDYAWTGLTANDVLTGNFTATKDHYYYLTENVTLASPITLSGPDTVLNLCLNEYTLTAPAANRAFIINGGTLNLTACHSSGTMAGTQYAKNGGMIYIQGVSGTTGEKGQLNVYGGTLRGGSAQNGVIAYVAWGSMNLYGGTLVGGTATNAGGVVFVNTNQTMNIFGGQVQNGTAAKKGDGILALAGTKVTVGGNPQVEEIYLNKGVKLYTDETTPLLETARIGVRMDTIGVFLDGITTYTEGIFLCRNTGKKIYWDSASRQLSVIDPT